MDGKRNNAKWFESYLSDRSQFVIVNGHRSSTSPITYGVPQGSVLGPLLFLIFINDIGRVSNLDHNPILFADDTNLFNHSPSLNDLSLKCQRTINSIANWIAANKLSINYDKSCYMVFSPKYINANDPNLNLNFNGSILKRVHSTTFLGVIIDDNLNWKFHISDLCLVLRRFIGIFYKLSSNILYCTLKLLYYGLVYPRILNVI